MTAATFAAYRLANIDRWEWGTADGSCREYERRQERGPYPVGGPELSAHLGCRCTIVAHLPRFPLSL